MHLVRREHGAATAEYAGVIVVIVALILALLMAAPGIGRTIACGITSTISVLLGGEAKDCSADAADPRAPHYPCVTQSQEHEVSVGASIPLKAATVEVDNASGIIIETMSDGTYRITDTSSAAGGIGAGKGDRVTFSTGDGQLTAGSDLGIGVQATMLGGTTYTVDNEQEKDALVHYLARRKAVEGVAPWRDPVTGLIGRLTNAVIDQIDDYEPPAPTEYYLEVGGKGDASAGAGGLSGGLDGQYSRSAVLGTTIRQDGSSTVYYRGSQEFSIQAGTLAAQYGLDVGGSTETVIALTYDAQGNTVSMELSVTGQTVGDDTGQVQTLSLDLKDQQDLLAASSLLVQAGLQQAASNLPLVSTAPNPQAPLFPFEQAVRDRGTWTIQDVTTEDQTYGADLILARGHYSDRTVTFSNGRYVGQDGQLHEWEGDC